MSNIEIITIIGIIVSVLIPLLIYFLKPKVKLIGIIKSYPVITPKSYFSIYSFPHFSRILEKKLENLNLTDGINNSSYDEKYKFYELYQKISDFISKYHCVCVVKINNKGKLPSEGTELRIPNCYLFEIIYEGSKQKISESDHIVNIGTIKPDETIIVKGWSRFYPPPINQKIRLSYKNGIGKVKKPLSESIKLFKLFFTLNDDFSNF